MKSLIVHPEKCTGCRNCIFVCSYQHAGFFDPDLSRIQVRDQNKEMQFLPVFCLQCGAEAACILICPTDALHFNAARNVVEWSRQKCLHCFLCVQACPYHPITVDSLDGSILKCDTCLGLPACVMVCPEGALEYVDVKSAGTISSAASE